MVNCEVNGCDNKTTYKSQEQIERENNGFNISFYKFPQSEDRRKLWVDALQKGNWIPNEKSVVCSDHFDTESLERSDVHSYISKFAVPTIFPDDTKPDVKNFEFIPFNDPNNVLQINKSTLENDDPLNTHPYEIAIKTESEVLLKESIETQSVHVKEELIEECEEPATLDLPVITSVQSLVVKPVLDQTMPQKCQKNDISAQTEESSLYLDHMIDSARNKEEGKTICYKRKIKTLQAQINKQDDLIRNLESKIAKLKQM